MIDPSLGNQSPGRLLAWQTLDKIESDDAYANIALHEILNAHREIAARERAFCTELVYGTLRNQIKIDYFLGRLLSRPLSSLKIPVKNLLRLSLYQLMFLTEIPERAVCHQAVSLIKQSKYSGLAPLVNGVLRSYLRQKADVSIPGRERDPIQYLSLEYSHPEWLVKRWIDHFGIAQTESILKADNREAPLAIRHNPLWGERQKLLESLVSAGWVISPGRFLPEAMIVVHSVGGFEEVPEFQSGAFFVQDESSMLVAHLMEPRPDEVIVDLCAAPGGKSTHLAELMGDRGTIFSVDNHQHKIELIAENADRLRLKSIHSALGDAQEFNMPDNRLADGVLVDAPCSGTGVLRRRVDARYRRKPEEIGELAAIQHDILENAATLVRPGGRLIYSTCTLEPEENDMQISRFITEHPEFHVADWRGLLPETIIPCLADSGNMWVNILPHPEAGDGFFMCRLEKSI